MASENRPDEDLSNVGTRKPDDAVGSRGPHAAGGGHRTSEQAAITGQGTGGRSDTERRAEWGGQSGGAAGQSPPAIGGSSGGHSDRKASAGPRAGAPVAGEPDRAKRS